jgi:hypothetical protein
MDALSLSHLTYCCATITVNFHRLDHPPFPCKSRLLRIRIVDKCLHNTSAGTSKSSLVSIPPICSGKATTHEASHHDRNSSCRPWHHRIRHWRNFLHPQEKSRRSWLGSDLSRNPGHPSSLADLQYGFTRSWPRSGRRGSEIEIREYELESISGKRAQDRSGLRLTPASEERARPSADADGYGLPAPRPSIR